MGRVISTAIRFIDGFTRPSKEVIDSMKKMANNIDKNARQIQSAGKTISSVGSSLSKAITVPVAGIAAGAVKMAADFESSMSQVAATMGKTKDDVKDLSELAQQMGKETAFSASEAAEGINVLAMAGLDATQITDSLGTVLDLAAAGAIDMGSSASYVVGAVKGFGDEMKNASIYADYIAKGATLASTDVAQFGEAISDGAATAAGYGQNLDDLTLSLLRMAEQNVTGSEAVTGLNAMMKNLYASTPQAKKALETLGVSAYDTHGAAKDVNTVVDELAEALKGMSDESATAYKSAIFSANGMETFNKMTTATGETLEKFRQGLSEASGSAATQAKTQLDNLNGQITLLKSAIEGTAITVGNKLLPHLEKFVSWVQAAADYVNNLSDAQVDNIMKWAGIAAVIPPIIMVFGKVITTIGKVQRTVGTIIKTVANFGGIIGTLTSPAGIVIGILAAIAAAAFLIIKNWDKVKGFLQNVGNWFKNAFEKAGFSVGDFKGKFASISSVIGSTAGKIAGFVKKIAGMFTIKNIFTVVGNAIKNVLSKCGVDLEKFGTNVNNIKVRISSIIKNLKTIFHTVFGEIGKVVKTVAGAAFTAMGNKVKQVMKIIVPVVKVAFSTIRGVIAAGVNNITAIISGVLTIFDGLTTFISGVFTGNWSKAWEGVKTIFKGVFESFAALCKTPINAVIGMINGAISGINKLGLTIPDWVPVVGGKSFSINIPTIPMLYKGTDNWKGGTAVIHDRGGEIVDLPQGTRVYPHDKSIEMARNDGARQNRSGSVSVNIQKLADKIEVRSDEDIDRIAEALALKLKKIAFNTP